jgi:carbonic anhydrase
MGLPLWLGFPKISQASGIAKALVLTCIDFRFVDLENIFLKSINLDHQYDLLTLAGASLALTNFPSEADTKTFWEQLDLSVKLHTIQKVIILDHQDCGAYAIKIDAHLSDNLTQEVATHKLYLNQASRQIKERYPHLEVELYFVKLDGTVETI